MLFTQVEFIIFFAVLILFLSFTRSCTRDKFVVRNIVLLLASYYFYAYWDWRFLSLIIISTFVDFFVGKRIARTGVPSERRILLFLSVFCNLAILGVFKYYNFFVVSFSEFLSLFGLKLGTFNIILPIGISFYTFQTMSYTIDIYRKRIQPCESFLNFALFVAFFPQLVAGPIVRARDLLPQIENPGYLSQSGVLKGSKQFIFGLFKKVFIADRIAYFVDYVFENVTVFDSLTVWIAVIAYAIQIYCDFSGYSDMAIGVARMMGYRFKKNFNHPYNSTNISEFWRKWHISLSSWLKDYVYISFGGNRGGRLNTYRNLMATMLLGGLWHGASWTFVVWGGIHGLALVAHKLYRETQKAMPAFAGWLLTMLTILTGWVFFRAQSFENAYAFLSKMFMFSSGIKWFQPFVLFAIFLMFVSHVLCVIRPFRRLRYLPVQSIKTSTILFTMLFLVILFYPRDFRPFIYFQF